MIKTTLLCLILLVTTCNSHKKMPEQSVDSIAKLHDIWALNSINGEEINRAEFGGQKRIPVLEIFIEEKRIGGNDSCNELFGTIENIDNSSINFVALGGTKMACPDMKLAYKYGKALVQTRSYKIEKLQLYLYDESGKELLNFIKVD